MGTHRFKISWKLYLSGKTQYWLTVHYEKHVLNIFENVVMFNLIRSTHSEVFLRKGVLKICSKFTGEHQCRSATSIKLLIEITLQHGCSPVDLLHIFRTPFPGNTSEWLLLFNKNHWIRSESNKTTFHYYHTN